MAGALTVSWKVVVWSVTPVDLPVTVTELVPVVAVEEAAMVKVEVQVSELVPALGVHEVELSE